jgi:CelD/BcsL family acetyltransferase involved in cellulose biosynthesis
MTAGSIAAELVPLADYADLASDWRALEAVADGSPFMAWPWVSTWLHNLPPEIRTNVFRARDADGVIALALLTEASGRGLRSLLGGTSLLLQETGDNDMDEITIEYAGLLARRGAESQGYAALFRTLTESPRWQNLRISASPHAREIVTALPANARAYSVHEGPSYLADLAGMRADGTDYISVLGSSTRYGLRRTRRAYEAHGEVRADIATDPAQALDWLHELRELHQRYWVGKGKRGSFGSTFFAAFHEDLVRENTTNGFTQLVRISAGSLIVGYLYNLKWRNQVYFYNAGLNYGAVPRQDRPGYLAHLVAIEKYLEDGVDTYDFLAGEGDYKRLMSTHKRMLNWMHVKRSGWRLACEKLLAPMFGRRSTNVPIVAPVPSDPVPLRP